MYFKHISDEIGILLQHIDPYSPQQNRVDERKKWSMKEMESFMLHAKSLTGA
jgi:hypothetical protein